MAWAWEIAEAELALPLPRRWAHSQGVAARAASLTTVVGDRAELLVSAAVLHDVGYAPRLAVAGFHPLFMMPVTARHHLTEHYTSPEKLSTHFSDGWNIQLTLRSGQYVERPHIGRPHPHTHRMGLLLATRTSPVTSERA